MRLLIIILLGIGLGACQSSETSTEREQMEVVTRFVTNVDHARLREAAGTDAEVVRTLPRGEELLALGSVSDFNTRTRLRGITFDEPWLQVRTSDGVEGWIYAGALSFSMDDHSALAAMLMERRLKTLFGDELSARIRSYRQSFHAANSAETLAMAYREGTTLRDTLVRIMEEKIEVDHSAALPDLFWLEQAMPGFEAQLVAEGTAYYLFWNYKTVGEKAEATSGAEDDAFAALQLSLFPDDSIEYFYPAWFLQTWDYGGHSLLGRGVHFATLQKIDQLLEKSDLFAPEMTRLKTRLVNDMTEPHVTYWETKGKIQAELDTIIGSGFSILNDADETLLKNRRLLFENPDSSNIEVNHQSGIYN